MVAPISVKGCSGILTDRAPGPSPDDDVELVVLHRRVEDLFDRRRHAVHFVDEEHLARLQVAEHRREIAGLLDHRPGRRPHRDAQLVGDDVRQRRLAEPGRAVEQHVVERFAALLRGGDRDVQILAQPVLPDVLVERPRPQPGLVLDVVVDAARLVTQAIVVRDMSQPGSGTSSAAQDILERRFELAPGLILQRPSRRPSPRPAADSRD